MTLPGRTAAMKGRIAMFAKTIRVGGATQTHKNTSPPFGLMHCPW